MWQTVFIWHLPCAYTSCYKVLGPSYLNSKTEMFTIIRALSLPLYPSFLKPLTVVCLPFLLIFTWEVFTWSLQTSWQLLSSRFFLQPVFAIQWTWFLSLNLALPFSNISFLSLGFYYAVFFSYLVFFPPSLSDSFDISVSLPLGDSFGNLQILFPRKIHTCK